MIRALKLTSKNTQLSHEGRTFTGYATVYDNVNTYGFSIAPGAYDEVLKAGAKPRMFFNHDSWGIPIGLWTKLESDETGLKVTGELTEGLEESDRVLACIKHGSIDGLSVCIGFDDDCIEGSKVTKILSLDEISVVTFPSDQRARITEALSAQMESQIKTLSTEKDFEDFLRDAGGLSRARAKQFISQAKSCLTAQRDADFSIDSNLLAEICRQSHQLIGK
ncbi:MAG: HK97 family phage prohead protease [Burkholderiales bacterium]|nr:HK97 family phage prohead protease [Burkholderiales bacterium]